MKGLSQAALRKLTQLTRPLALRSAGKAGSDTSVVRHVGRQSGRIYETPVVAVAHDDTFLVALPYGDRTDWLKNVVANGKADIVNKGEAYSVDRPEVVPMAEVTAFFRPKEQRLHRRFNVDSALRVRAEPTPR
jgi:deazaflavin-dependent oxidoreductase (nitroreductase family)